LGRVDTIALLGAVAIASAASGDTERAARLLEEAERTPNIGSDDEYPKYLPAMARTAIELGEPEVAERLASHLAPRFPNAEYAQAAVQAALAESRGDMETASDAYADVASQWENFGAVPEQGFALLGQGRCLLELSRPGESTEVLQQAREIFRRCGMRPALEATDALMAKATALSS
jgi:tetratricopeptide (TPR) repeat protein